MKDRLASVLPAAVNDLRRWTTPEPLGVAPQPIGVALATPVRRAGAMGIDLPIVALLSGVSGLWWLGDLAAVVLQRRSQLDLATRKRQIVGWCVAGLLGLPAVQETVDTWQDWRRPAPETRVLRQALPVVLVDEADEADGPAAAAPAAGQDQRIVQPEEQVRQLEQAARTPKSVAFKAQLGRFLDDLGAGLG